MEPQAFILRSLVAQLERQEAAGDETLNGIAGEFARLKNQSTKYRTDKNYPSKTAEKQENIKKNRYKDIVPFDHSRVKLTLTTSKNDTDYINASFIKGVSGSKAYIATQGPLPNTVLDFLKMLWEYNIKVVVMACREFEMGKKKCESYWPQTSGQSFVCEPFTVHCDSEENKGDYVTRMLRLTYGNFTRILKQLHYVNWPDHGVPDSIPPILEMLQEMRSYQPLDDIPICIHCSAGCGRTGVLCAIDYTWNLLKKQMITLDFSIFDLVLNMRMQRPSLVQTKEQYDLVYRTIKLLFQRYLESMDVEPYRNEVHENCTLNDLSDDLHLQPQLQKLLDEERAVLSYYHMPIFSASESPFTVAARDTHIDQQQWQQLPSVHDALFTAQDLQERAQTSPTLHHRAPAEEDMIQENSDIPSLNPPPPPAVPEAVCLMVEDPYFDTPMSSPSSEEAPLDSNVDNSQWIESPIFSTPSLFVNDQLLDLSSDVSGTVKTHSDEDSPPPLPERTPESYELAEDTDLCETLAVIISPNAATEAANELGGSPPSPAPPLPERTPESYELAIDEAPVQQNIKTTSALNLTKIGTSSEWSGNSIPVASADHTEMKPWTRSKSMKAKMTFTAVAPVPTIDLDLALNPPSSLYPSLGSMNPPPLFQSEDSMTPPLPDRTPESFLLNTEEIRQQTAQCLKPPEAAQSVPNVGMSFEWDGNSQPKTFLDVVATRSKSVRAKSSKQEPLSVFQQFPPPPVVVAGGGSAQVGQHELNCRVPLSSETSGNKSDKSNDKSMCRTKSLKFFRHKQKPKTAPPPPPTQPGPPLAACSPSSVFRFGFGNRFGKPKGPRRYPETWI
ncbi:tyrosine-protein phosphatase non-receptor type 22 isoform X1 [Channa argus]|uniref:tyrosine-protein phosphatase non-receptor type 22 isoform X1 n=1 Tax=Channa argus TaxID=215402 RepID=UPI0029467AFF|nr:hypothetical protein Q8A73_013623 [Channa argus]